MDVRVTADGVGSAGDLRSLLEWLGETAELRGAVRTAERPPVPGTLGPVLDALLVAIGPGGVASAFAVAVVAWIRHRQGEVTLRLTRPDGGSVELSAQRVRRLTSAELRAQVEQLTEVLQDGFDGRDGGSLPGRVDAS